MAKDNGQARMIAGIGFVAVLVPVVIFAAFYDPVDPQEIRASIEAGDLAQAQQDFERLQRLKPDHPELNALRAELHSVRDEDTVAEVRAAISKADTRDESVSIHLRDRLRQACMKAERLCDSFVEVMRYEADLASAQEDYDRTFEVLGKVALHVPAASVDAISYTDDTLSEAAAALRQDADAHETIARVGQALAIADALEIAEDVPPEVLAKHRALRVAARATTAGAPLLGAPSPQRGSGEGASRSRMSRRCPQSTDTSRPSANPPPCSGSPASPLLSKSTLLTATLMTASTPSSRDHWPGPGRSTRRRSTQPCTR